MKSFIDTLLLRLAHLNQRLKGDTVKDPAEVADPESLIQTGRELFDAGRNQEALTILDRAVNLAPKLPRAYHRRGNVHLALLDWKAAEEDYLRALQLDPSHAPTYMNLGNVRLEHGVLAEAAWAYRNALRLRPDWAEAWVGLGCALESEARVEAIAAYREALRLESAHAGAANNLASLLLEDGQAAEALRLLDSLLAYVPDEMLLMSQRAHLLRRVGRSDEALADYGRIVAANPDDLATFSSMLFTLNFMPGVTGEKLMAEHREFGRRAAQRVSVHARPPERMSDAGRRLRVGYVSPDFRRHPIAFFMESLLREHDRDGFDIHCFYNFGSADEATERLAALAGHWHDIWGMDDDGAAALIEREEIDILVDLSGHTAHNRLGLFARRAAPVQISWLGYPCTTGLETMDFRICDEKTDPPMFASKWQTEVPLYMPDSQWCYTPQVALPKACAAPQRRNGYWTFGSFNQPAKLNRQVVRTWAQVLGTFPGSRLVLGGIDDLLCLEWVEAELFDAGVGRGQLEFRGRQTHIEDYYAAYNDIDICLDTFPYNGFTTSCDALAMGVPLAVVRGHSSAGLGGASILTVLGIEDWIAETPSALPSLLQRHLADPGRVEALRLDLPARMRASPLMDAHRFARNIEAAYRHAWGARCKTAAMR